MNMNILTHSQLNKIRGKWIEHNNSVFFTIRCSKCSTIYPDSCNGYKFCPRRGTPMTDEAVEILRGNIIKLYYNQNI